MLACIVSIVSSKEEVGSPDSFCIDPVDLNSFFDEDGKIYGYRGLKVIKIVANLSLPEFYLLLKGLMM